MITSIDHLVVRVNDLDQAITDYTNLGFEVVRGGEHADGITHNALIVFSDGTYIELLAFKQPDPCHRWWREGPHSEGFIDFAFLSDAIEQDVFNVTNKKLLITLPRPGGRIRPDGQQIEWKTAWTEPRDVPFLCADVTPRRLRVPEGLLRWHNNGAKWISNVTVLCSDLYTSIVSYLALFGLAGKQQERASSRAAAQLNIVRWRITGLGLEFARFKLGRSNITLAAPTSWFHNGTFGDQVREHIDTWGPGPFAFSVHVEPGKPTLTLETRSTHGARIEMVSDISELSVAL